MNKTRVCRAKKLKNSILLEDWKTMHKAIEWENENFREISEAKIHALVTYFFIMIPVASCCIASTHSIVYVLLFTILLLFPFCIYLRWRRFYNYRLHFPSKSSISIKEVKQVLNYPEFLIRLDFKSFSKNVFFKDAYFASKQGVLILHGKPESFVARTELPVEDSDLIAIDSNTEESFSIEDFICNLQKEASSVGQEALSTALCELASSLASVKPSAFDTQFGRHLWNVYFEPLSKLLGKLDCISAEDHTKLLDLLQTLVSFVEEVKQIEELSESNSISISLDAMLRLAKMDRKVVRK